MAPRHVAQPALDPRYLIARDTGFVDHDRADDRHAVILQCPPDATGTADPAARVARLGQALGTLAVIEPVYGQLPGTLNVATATVTTSGLRVLERWVPGGSEREPLLQRFEYAQALWLPRERIAPGLQVPPGSAVASVPGAPTGTAATPGPVRVLHAVIDLGCPFMHPLLLRGAGRSTRVRALWDQQPVGGGGQTLRPPAGFTYGTELDRAALEAVIAQAGGDASRAYALLGSEAARRRQSHDAHALGPSRDGAVAGPDLSVCTDDGHVLRGRRSIGNAAGVSFRMDGPSVAAPLTAHRDGLETP